jgi:hypothetical protein
MTNAAFLTAKIIDIGLVVSYYIVAAFLLSWVIDVWTG